ncbi:IFT81 [Cordylochernes scorpioides]|uniref:IFT81 n=1 Tax=Cordylochernes scorpioides TaxID=51811 RepID=A0ABY6LE09_9ARAC|nr:IFT81 [Cordylochernes scorpioides]
MSEQIKLIIQELSKEPFNKKFNIISFDSLRNESLLKILFLVFSHIDPKMKIDIKMENPDQVAVKMLNFLRILKYKPPADIDLSTFRQGLISGEKTVMYHILYWALQRLPELQKRAYLARFLVKVDISPEVEGDSDIMELYQQYEGLMEQFKEVHRAHEVASGHGQSTAEIRRDIAHMEEEREALTKRVERLARRAESHPGREAMLAVTRKLREEQDRAEHLDQQKQELKMALVHTEQKSQRLTQRLKEMRHLSIGTTPEGLVNKVEEELRVNTYMVKEKLPKELATLQTYVNDLQKVIMDPNGPSDLHRINLRIQEVNQEVNQLIEKRLMSSDPMDDKLSLFRQQAAIINRRKETAAEELNTAKAELGTLQEELRTKQQDQGVPSEEVLKGEEFKRYVSKLRSTSTVYKAKRQQLSDLKSECGILTRTLEILEQKEKATLQTLSSLEEREGVGGFHTTQEELEKVSTQKSELDQQKQAVLSEMSTLVRRLNARVAEKKARLAPIIRELRPLRQRCQDLSQEHEQKKSAYDSCAAGLDSGLSKLEQEVKRLREEVRASESKKYYLLCMVEILESQSQLAQEEVKAYLSQEAKKKTLRDQINKKIAEAEEAGKVLREEQKEVRESQASRLRQRQLWDDTARLLAAKLAWWQQQAAAPQPPPATASVDRLVL